MAFTPPPLRDGQVPTAADYNRLRDLIEGLMRSTGPGVSFNNNSLTLKPTDADRIFARITSQGSGSTPAYAYGWNRVFPNGSGGWTDGPTSGADLQWGSPAQSPAWELRQNTAVPVNGSVIVELISGAAETANWYFSFIQDLFGTDPTTNAISILQNPTSLSYYLNGDVQMVLGPQQAVDASLVVPVSALPCEITGLLTAILLGPASEFNSGNSAVAALYASIVVIDSLGNVLGPLYQRQKVFAVKADAVPNSVIPPNAINIIYTGDVTDPNGGPGGAGQLLIHGVIPSVPAFLPPGATSFRLGWLLLGSTNGFQTTPGCWQTQIPLGAGLTSLTYRGL